MKLLVKKDELKFLKNFKFHFLRNFLKFIIFKELFKIWNYLYNMFKKFLAILKISCKIEGVRLTSKINFNKFIYTFKHTKFYGQFVLPWGGRRSRHMNSFIYSHLFFSKQFELWQLLLGVMLHIFSMFFVFL